MKLKLKLLLAASLLAAPGCQCQRNGSVAQAFPARDNPVLFATEQVEMNDVQDFFRRVFGEPVYVAKFSEVTKYSSGSVDDVRTPYYDTWYPEAQRGTNQSDTLTKYDQAFFSGESKAAGWEAANHSRKTPAWYGHCNGTSVAGARYQSPKSSVRRPKGCAAGAAGCVEFTPTDIRALLSEMSMNAKAKFISGRRCNLTAAQVKGRPLLRSNPEVQDACDDVNPGTFHLALVNFLGRMKQPVIFDENMNDEVWNYTVYKYRSTFSAPLDEGQAIAALQLGTALDSWVFNKKARSWYKVTTTVSYRSSSNEINQYSGWTNVNPQEITYDYVIEVDENGDVIGGEWVGASRYNHPDFLWMPFEPSAPTGDSSRGNPHLSNTEVTSLWAESMGFDTENPFRDKPKNPFDIRFYPPGDLNWGTVPGYYRVLLDGRTTGSLFLGKKSHFRIDVAEILRDSNVEIFLNGKAIDTVTPSAGQADILFDSPPGLNILTLKWASARVSDSELDWEFRYIAM
ncbi:MAG: hypothetical protein EOP10_11520 [Proteobacteria bacterium]|nr:MAG: hypothetical protein EOP10_11520 [Pseudomonadota bacterium]